MFWVMKLRKPFLNLYLGFFPTVWTQNLAARWTPPDEDLVLNLSKPALDLIPPDILISLRASPRSHLSLKPQGFLSSPLSCLINDSLVDSTFEVSLPSIPLSLFLLPLAQFDSHYFPAISGLSRLRSSWSTTVRLLSVIVIFIIFSHLNFQ